MDRMTARFFRIAGFVFLLFAGSLQSASAQGIGLAQLMKITDWGTESLVLFDQMEIAPATTGTPLSGEVTAWYGGAFSRLWVDGDFAQMLSEGGGGEAEATVSYGRLVTPFFDLLAGARWQGRWEDERDDRFQLAVGLRGVAPLRFELSPTVYVTPQGDLSGRLTAEYQLLITQRLVLTPDVELRAALQEVPEWQVGSGLNSVDAGVRLRYEPVREFGPYVGLRWNRAFASTARMREAAGETAEGVEAVAGLRFWF